MTIPFKELEKLYLKENRYPTEIADMYNTSVTVVCGTIKNYGMPSITELKSRRLKNKERVCSGCHKLLSLDKFLYLQWKKRYTKQCTNCRNEIYKDITKEKLEKLYYVDRLGPEEIGKIFNLSKTTIAYRMKELGLLNRRALNTKIREGECDINRTCITCKNNFSIAGEYVWLTNQCKKCYSKDKRKERAGANKNKTFCQSDFPSKFICIKCQVEKDINNFRFRKDLYNYVSICQKCESIQKRKYDRYKRRTNPIDKLKHNVSRSVRYYVKKNKGTKNCSTWKKLPYTPQELRKHLESQWEPWMLWGNYGSFNRNKITWQIDHIIPQSKLPFDSLDHPNFLKCWNLSNLRPLEALENNQKSDKII